MTPTELITIKNALKNALDDSTNSKTYYNYTNLVHALFIVNKAIHEKIERVDKIDLV